jgi:mannan endo-1,4-beta-mannosidase
LAQQGILFAHQDTLAYGMGWKADANDFDSDVYRICGKFPAVFGWDIGHIGEDANIDGVPFENMKTWIARGYAAGGVNTMSWHARIPGTGQSSWTRERVVYRLLPNGDLHATYLAKLDQVADFLQDLKGPEGRPVPIVFRPFHEHNGSWFWWGSEWCTPDEYKQLWHMTIDYLRQTKGLHNLITCYSPDRFEDEAHYVERYPGDDYVDVVGHDNYSVHRSDEALSDVNRMLGILVSVADEHNKVAAFTETGLERIPDATWWTEVLLDTIKSSPAGRQLAWVLVWRNGRPDHYYAPYPGQTSAEDFRRFEADPFTLFLEDLPPMYE